MRAIIKIKKIDKWLKVLKTHRKLIKNNPLADKLLKETNEVIATLESYRARAHKKNAERRIQDAIKTGDIYERRANS